MMFTTTTTKVTNNANPDIMTAEAITTAQNLYRTQSCILAHISSKTRRNEVPVFRVSCVFLEML